MLVTSSGIIRKINILINDIDTMDNISILSKQLSDENFNENLISDYLQDITTIKINVPMENLMIIDILFRKYAYLFTNLYEIFIHTEYSFIPSSITHLTTTDNVESNEELQLEKLHFRGYEIGDILNEFTITTNFNPKSLKSLTIDKKCSNITNLDLIEEMDNLETLIFCYITLVPDKEIIFSDKVNYLKEFHGYCGLGEIPPVIDALGYYVRHVTDISRIKIKKLHLYFYLPYHNLVFENDTVTDLSISTTLNINDIEFNFPNIRTLLIDRVYLDDSNDFVKKLIDKSEYLIEMILTNRPNNKNQTDYNDFICPKNVKYMHLKSYIGNNFFNIESNDLERFTLSTSANTINMDTPLLKQLHFKYLSEYVHEQFVSFKTDQCLDIITISMNNNNVILNIGELKTRNLSIFSYDYDNLQTIVLPSYYIYLEIHGDNLLQSWINNEVKTLDIHTCYDLSKIGVNKINAIFFKKIIVNNQFNWRQYIIISDHCEIVVK